MLEIREGLCIPDSDLEWRVSRAGGPGGQHVNTTSTQVELRFDVDRCELLNEPVKERLRALAGSRLSKEGVLRVVSGASRSQLANKDDCEERLRALILEALKPPPKKRRPTKPSRAAQQRRIQTKKARGQLKKLRGRGDE